MPMKRYKSAARCLCPTRREPRANMRDLNLLSQFSKQCLSKRHICDMQFADVAWALKTQTAINQAWPNAVFGLRPRLFFLLIPYIHIFVLHNRRLYERKRPYHLRANDLRGNGTDPGDDSVHPHALRCLPLQFCRIQGVQNRHCSQRRPEHGHLHSLPDPARS